MFSASKLWPRLFGQRGRDETQQGFVPTTALAARIVSGNTRSSPTADDERHLTSFDLQPQAAPSAADSDGQDEVAESARQAERFVPDRTTTTLTDKRGKSIRARIINVSATGVAVEADFSTVPPEAIVFVGQKPVRIGRTIRRGQVFLFEKPLDPARCNRQIVL